MSDWWMTLVTLVMLELVLGVDNIIMLTMMVSRIPKHQRTKARFYGLLIAMLGRIGLLLSVTWISSLRQSMLTIGQFDLSIHDLIFFIGGFFLIVKSCSELVMIRQEYIVAGKQRTEATVFMTLFQIVYMDLVFSFDSVFTAVALTDQKTVMVVAIIISVSVMLFAVKPIGDFVDRHTNVKVLALLFLILLGGLLVSEGFHYTIPKKYLYSTIIILIAAELFRNMLQKILR